MKKIIGLLVVSSLFLTSCEFIRTKILGKPSKAEMERMEYLQDSIRIADSIANELAEKENYVLDSIEAAKAKAEADSLAELQRKKEEASRNKYHVISGSFRTPSFADRYKERMLSEGYQDTRIVQASNGFNLVSISQYPSYGSALNEARNLNNDGAFEVWVYVAN